MVKDILVHISTPATRQNDHLYRSLADAYLDFEPHIGDRGQGTSLLSCPQDDSAATEAPQQNLVAGSSILSTSIESYGSFPSYISSVGQSAGSHDVDIPQKPAFTNNGSVPTSSRLAQLDQLHMRWKEQTTPKSSFVDARQYLSKPVPALEHAETDFIEDTQLGAQALQSQLQDSYSTTSQDTSGDESEPSKHRPEVTPAGYYRNDPNIVSREALSTTHSKPSTTATSSTKQPVLTRSKDTMTSSPWVAQPPSKKQKAEKDDRDFNKVYNFNDLPLDVFPPAPKISIACPGKLPSQITKHLAAIKAQNTKRFKLSKKYSTPKIDDRGYWFVVCSKWLTKVQHEFWTSLSEHVSSGRLGWGITLHRDASASQALGWIRLYCWAEVVEHTWLSLWLCSKGEVVGTGCKWVDAGGSVVFETE
jgi:hypothetical protein